MAANRRLRIGRNSHSPAHVPTAFNRADEIDRAAVARLVERLIAAGTGGIVPIGGTGEYTALSLHLQIRERARLADRKEFF